MGYKALITIDLPYAESEQRKKYYQVLEEAKWTKITELTTAWKVTFREGVSYMHAVSVIQNVIRKAEKASDTCITNYAMHLGLKNVVLG